MPGDEVRERRSARRVERRAVCAWPLTSHAWNEARTSDSRPPPRRPERLAHDRLRLLRYSVEQLAVNILRCASTNSCGVNAIHCAKDLHEPRRTEQLQETTTSAP